MLQYSPAMQRSWGLAVVAPSMHPPSEVPPTMQMPYSFRPVPLGTQVPSVPSDEVQVLS